MVTEGKPKDRLGGRGRSVASAACPGAFHGNTPGHGRLGARGTGPW